MMGLGIMNLGWFRVEGEKNLFQTPVTGVEVKRQSGWEKEERGLAEFIAGLSLPADGDFDASHSSPSG
jgi:hypothetical protein